MHIKFQTLPILKDGKEFVTWGLPSAWRALAKVRRATDRRAKGRTQTQTRPGRGLAFGAIRVFTVRICAWALWSLIGDAGVSEFFEFVEGGRSLMVVVGRGWGSGGTKSVY